MRGFRDEDREDDGALTASAASCEICGRFLRTSATGKAKLFSDGIRQVWVPVSLVRACEPIEGSDAVTITVPEWFAKKEGLI